MEPVYKPSAPIALMKSFNPPNEVSGWYIQWLIGKSLSPNVQSLHSVEFKAGDVELDDSPKLWLKWRFEYDIDEVTKLSTISLIRTDDMVNSDASDVPIICRLAMMNKLNGVTKYFSSLFVESTVKSKYRRKIFADDASELDLPNGHYVVHCWLDIPTKVIGGKPPSTCDPLGNSGSALIASGVASLFKEVVSPKTDDLTGTTSDIVLITEKGEREERRFNCHRNILSIRSPVFNTMLTSKRFKEGNEGSDVDIEDVAGDVLEIVLKYIYTGECPSDIDFATIRRVIDVAEKYMLPELKDECVRHLLIDADDYVEDWADYLAMSETYNIGYLKNISLMALSSNMRAMGEKEVREILSDRAMISLANAAAERWERSIMMHVKNSG